MLDPQNVLKLLGVDSSWSYPIATDCPLCNSPGKLEIRNAGHAHCRECYFTGDLIELLAAKLGESLLAATDDLMKMALLDWTERQRKEYLNERGERQRLIHLWQAQCRVLKQNVSGSIRAVLSENQVMVSDRAIKDLVPHLCTLRQEDLEGAGITLPRTARQALRWWGRYTALAVPAWSGIDIAGFYLFTVKGHRYLPISEQGLPGSLFGLVPSFTDDYLVLVDDPQMALRMTFWSAACNGRPTGFIYTHGARDHLEDFQCGEAIFWSPGGDLRHYIRALDTPGARTLDHRLITCDLEKRLPFQGNWSAFEYQLVNALGCHQQLALHLLDLTVADVRPLMTHLTIDPGDRVKIMAHVGGEDARHLERIFSNTFIREETVTWNGVLIADSPEGWRVKGKVISAAKFHLDQIRPDGKDDATVMGTISYRAPNGERVNFNFRDKLSRITRNPGMWLQSVVRNQCGSHPYVERSWTHKLFEVAQQFHTPTAVMSDQVYGWSDGKLRMPCFSVDENSLQPTRSLLSGPGIKLPAPMSTREWLAFKSAGFCRVVLAFVGNLVRTSRGRHGVGVMLTNEPHMVSRIARAFGAQVVTNPSVVDIDERGLGPLPLFTEWSDYHLSQVMKSIDGYKNVLLSVDNRTARLSRMRPDWLQLRVGEQLDYEALRVIFLLLPRAIRCRSLEIDSETFYRDLADVLIGEVGDRCRHHRLLAAAIDLDTHNCYKGGTAATRILELIFYGQDRGEIQPAYLDDGVSVSKAEFMHSLTNGIVPVPDEQELTNRLRDARFLIDDTDDRWVINLMDWNMNASLARC